MSKPDPKEDFPEKAKRALDKKAQALGVEILTYYQIPMTYEGDRKDAPSNALVYIGDIGSDRIVTFTILEGKATVEPRHEMPSRH